LKSGVARKKPVKAGFFHGRVLEAFSGASPGLRGKETGKWRTGGFSSGGIA
jgi:hypothetical protein